jgi:hypothetical protein
MDVRLEVFGEGRRTRQLLAGGRRPVSDPAHQERRRSPLAQAFIADVESAAVGRAS